MRPAVTGALIIAAVSTLGDFMWAGLRLPHHTAFGLIHGALLCLCIGAYLGSRMQRAVEGAITGTIVGLIAAGSFYALAPLVGYSVMFAVWAFIWLAFAMVTGRRTPISSRLPWPETVTRGFLAMIGSGIGFYLISGIWRPFDPKGWDYAFHFFSWTVAYLPAFAALLVRR